MADQRTAHPPGHEPHPWADLAPEAVIDKLVYELYGPVSALGAEVNRLSSGAFEDDELSELLDRIAESVNDLSRLVVILKRYARDRAEGATGE